MNFKDPFSSGCLNCKHFFMEGPSGSIYLYCKAYPHGEGIPEDIILGAKHKKVRDDQVGEFVFEKMKR